MDLVGWTILKLEIGNEVVYHEMGVVKELPVPILVGGEMMRPHCCSLQYTAAGRNNFYLGVSSCSICRSNLTFLQGEHSPQLTKVFPRSAPVKIQTFALIPGQRVSVLDSEPVESSKQRSKSVVDQEKLRTVLS